MRTYVSAGLMIAGGLLLLLGDGKLISHLGMDRVHIFRPTIYVQAEEETKISQEILKPYVSDPQLKELADQLAESMLAAADEADKTPPDPPEKVLAFFRSDAQSRMGETGWKQMVPVVSEYNSRLVSLRAAEKLPDCANVSVLYRAWAAGVKK